MLLTAVHSAQGSLVALGEMACLLAAGPLGECPFCLAGQMDEEAPSPLTLGVKNAVSGQENTTTTLFYVYSFFFLLPRGLVGPRGAALGSLG